MLSKAQEKLIKSLHTKKGRQKHNRCLVEGHKNVREAEQFVDFAFLPEDTENFDELVTTQTPQKVAAVAHVPEYELADIEKHNTIIVLDGVQDPGNVGSILRLCLGFQASLLLVESADVTDSKVIRSSAGAFFQTAWKKMSRSDAQEYIANQSREIYRLELNKDAKHAEQMSHDTPSIIIAGSEGNGIQLDVPGTSIIIRHEDALESLNVTHAVAIALYTRYMVKFV